MRYKIQRMDRRHRYHDRFSYYVQFPKSMFDTGILNFTRVVKWFTDTYGWTTEVSLYDEIARWVSTQKFISKTNVEMPAECNPLWSWSKDYDGLRIYIATDAVLAFFLMAHPLDQK